MVRPILPVVEYYLNYDYINEQLCENRDKPYLECNGTCYLQKQLDKINPQHPDQKPISSLVFDLKEYPVSTLDFCLYNNKIVFENRLSSLIYSLENHQKYQLHFDIFHPPIIA